MPARPRLVPDRPLRAVALIRVSKERDEMVSPEIQVAAIRDHCERRGYDLVGTIEGIDESGSRRRSPWWARLDQAVSQVEAGDADVLVVWKFDRTSRNRLRWAVALDRLDLAGGQIDSATEPLDTSTPSGRFARGMLAEMAAYRAEEIGAVWRDVHARRVRQGRPATGKPRWGYEYADGAFRPDPKTGPILASLYRRFVAGESFYTLVGWLNAEGYPTSPGYSRGGPGPWKAISLRRTLDSGFGAGLFMAQGELVPGTHEPVIDADLWQAYLVSRAARRGKPRTERSTYLLSGMVRCMHDVDGKPCGSTMGGNRPRPGSPGRFVCMARVQERRHPGGSVSMHRVEDRVLEWLADVADEVNAGTGIVPAAAAASRDADAIAREIAALQTQLGNLTRQLGREIISETAYADARRQIEDEQALLRLQHAQAAVALSRAELGPTAANLLRHWEALTVAERRAMLRKLIRRVDVWPGRPLGHIEVVPVE